MPFDNVDYVDNVVHTYVQCVYYTISTNVNPGFFKGKKRER